MPDQMTQFQEERTSWSSFVFHEFLWTELTGYGQPHVPNGYVLFTGSGSAWEGGTVREDEAYVRICLMLCCPDLILAGG